MTRKFVLHTHKKVDATDFSEALNEEQLAVATAPGGPMLVVAGAGTGKTRALTYRLAWLVRAGVDPGRILLVTFTNRAAREMVHRVELLVEQQTRHLWAGTFHHVANRILRQYGSKLGISPEFTILDREDASGLLKSCVPESGVPIEQEALPAEKSADGDLQLPAEHAAAAGRSPRPALSDVRRSVRGHPRASSNCTRCANASASSSTTTISSRRGSFS